jgi:hypothetical protein
VNAQAQNPSGNLAGAAAFVPSVTQNKATALVATSGSKVSTKKEIQNLQAEVTRLRKAVVALGGRV